MPYSDNRLRPTGLQLIRTRFGDPLAALTFLDVGAGAGSNLEFYRPWFPNSRWIGVEVWQPYVDRFSLVDRYSHVLIDDVRRVPLPPADVVLLGDVLEHMSIEEASEVWLKATAAARDGVVLASLPLGEYPQGAVHGNPYEAHRSTWTQETADLHLPGARLLAVNEVVGLFAALVPVPA
jgi:hypothetical protein